jgi:DNA-binding MarR family transcriptional regulator
MNDEDSDLKTVLAGSVASFGLMVRSLAPAMERVTMQQYRILVLICTQGPMRSSDLATELGVLPSGITRMVNRLIRDGLAEKKVAEQNRREVMVEATAEGVGLVREVFERRQEDFRLIVKTMSPSDRRAVVQASAALVEALAGRPELDAHLLPSSLDGSIAAPD